MRDLPRKDRVAMTALANAIEHEPALRGPHSAKPEAFLDVVERVSPAPRLEMFARRDRLGWDTWGNESLGTAEMAA